MSALLDYTLDSPSVTNPDSTIPATFTGTVVDGPGTTELGTYPHALAIAAGGGSAATVDVSALAPDRTRFTVETVLRLDAAPSAPQPILSSALLPFSLTAVPAVGGYAIRADIGLVSPALDCATTVTVLKAGEWHAVALAYDLDTIGVFVDGVIESVHAYADGTVAAAGPATLTVASGPVGIAIAALRWQDGIDPALETQLDDRRDGPEWAITRKRESLGAGFGAPQGAIAQNPSTSAWMQSFTGGLISWAESTGVACEMHGAIWSLYTQLDDTAPLGLLISDEVDGSTAGSRRSTFTQGTIYWSAATGAVPVIGHLYIDYERLGGPASVLGLPTALADAVPNGLEQVFEGGRLYFRTGAGAAHEVHGAILAQFLATGGTQSWGFPLSDEADFAFAGTPFGRTSEFENATFLWSAASGAHELHGDLRNYWRSHPALVRDLGMPTSDEQDIPGAAGRMNTFERGSLLWYGSAASILCARPFRVHFGRVDTVEEEGFGMGQNDVYGRITLTQGGATLYDQRQPGSGDSDDHNVVDWNVTLPVELHPNTLDGIGIAVDLWDSDGGAPFGGGDDHLGTWNYTLDPANGYGYGIPALTIDSGKFSDVNSIQVTLQPIWDPSEIGPNDRWWAVTNQGTKDIPYPLYAAAFEDVDSDPEWSDPVDWLEKLYYSAVVEGLAAHGNCFGMSLASIDADKGTGPYSQPISQYTDWGGLEQQFNVRHQYQVGAGPIWWFVGQFLSGNTHSPKQVFQDTLAAAGRGDDPVLCISQHSDFSGAPHCIRPYEWHTETTPWTIMVHDPNHPGAGRPLLVDPTADTYHYDGGGAVYDGTASSGGRMHYMPYHLLCHRQETPVGEALALILAGTILVLGAGTSSSGITDTAGKSIDATGQDAAAALAAGRRLDGYFVAPRGVSDGPRLTTATRVGRATRMDDALRETGRAVLHPGVVIRVDDDPIRGGLLLKPGADFDDAVLRIRRRRGPLVDATASVVGISGGVQLTGAAATAIAHDAGAVRAIAARTPQNVLADASLVARLDPAVIAQLTAAVGSADGDFVHHAIGTDSGGFEYAIHHGLTQVHVSSPLAAGEATSVAVTALGTAKSVVALSAATAKQATVRIEHRLGVGGDHLAVTLSELPVAPGQDLRVNPKPGLGGVEVTSGTAKLDVPVTVEGVIDGRRIGGSFQVAMDGGLRLSPAALIASDGIRVGTIGELFGPATATALVRSA